MKTLRQLLLMSCVLAVGLGAKEESSAPAQKADPARDLVWPEITNAKALIALAKAATKEDLDEGIHGKQLQRVRDPLLDYLHPRGAWADEDYILIILDTHPFTGQALVVAPAPSALKDALNWLAWVGDTSVPEIKRVLIKLSEDSPEHLAMLGDFSGARVWWKELVIESPATASCPYPIKILTPGYREDMAAAGIDGEAKMTFTVTERGEIRDVEVKATHLEFAGPTEEAIKLWKFEPGVDRKTRLPVAVRVSVTAVFRAVE
jgi:hypothetical protein